jgi:hypothetical protein
VRRGERLGTAAVEVCIDSFCKVSLLIVKRKKSLPSRKVCCGMGLLTWKQRMRREMAGCISVTTPPCLFGTFIQQKVSTRSVQEQQPNTTESIDYCFI